MTDIKNPVLNPDIVWSDTTIKCPVCRSKCRISPIEKAPNGTPMQLVNCLSKDHFGGDFGFYVAVGARVGHK